MFYYAVWGNGNTEQEVGIIAGPFENVDDARRVAEEWLGKQDNPAVGAWIRAEPIEDDREAIQEGDYRYYRPPGTIDR